MRAPEVGDYLEHVANLIGEIGGEFVADPLIRLNELQRTGYLQLAVHFHDGSRFSVKLLAFGPGDYPDWLAWRIHYMDSTHRAIFRYDTSRHLPGSPNFPSHKHVGDTVVDHARPSVADIIREVREHLYPAAS